MKKIIARIILGGFGLGIIAILGYCAWDEAQWWGIAYLGAMVALTAVLAWAGSES